MERSDLDQAVEILTRTERGVLIAVPEAGSRDALAAALGLALALERLGKSTTVVSAAFVPRELQFLPGTAQVRSALPEGPELVLELPLGGRRPGNVTWDLAEETLRVTITPEDGRPLPPDVPVTVRRGGYAWDRIATIGAPRLAALGRTFTDHSRFFYDTPMLNLDRGAANEFFGTVNLVPATVGTVTEVVADLLDTLGGVNLYTPEVATCLLAGVTAGTDSFRAPTTTPNTFHLASELVAAEADRAAVVRHLYHTHPLVELKLLGRSLGRITELDGGLLVTTLSLPDFTALEVSADVVPTILRDVTAWAGEQRAIAIAFERTPKTLEALVALGRVSTDDRERFRQDTQGTLVGPFILVNLGSGPLSEAARLLREKVVPRLPSVR